MTVTKAQAESLIERLADNQEEALPSQWGEFDKSIMLMDVLEKIIQQENRASVVVLPVLWKDCGFTKSLQQILEEAEWAERGENHTSTLKKDGKTMLSQTRFVVKDIVMTGPAAELFVYLIQLFPETDGHNK